AMARSGCATSVAKTAPTSAPSALRRRRLPTVTRSNLVTPPLSSIPDVGIERPRFCSQCGAPLAGTAWFSHDISWRPWIALLLSVVPGLGHFYKGQVGRAIAWFVV